MSEYVRIIPRLDIKGPNLVKGVNLEGLRVLGKPEKFARYYYEAGADELLYMDVVASLYGRNSILEMIERTSRDIFVPLTVGGGMRNLEDIRTALNAGADKVSMNTAAIGRPELIMEAARKFGSSTIVVSVEAKKIRPDHYEAYIDNGREATGVDACEWALRAAELGAGEILLTSIDHEGTGSGYDLELTQRISESVQIPVIACGGAGTVGHCSEVIRRGKADAISLASVLHYDCLRKHEGEDDFSAEGNVEFLKGIGVPRRIETATISHVKEHLAESGIKCRQDVREQAGR